MPAAEPHLVPPPAEAVVRVGYRPDPFVFREPERLEDDADQWGPLEAGNRFDAPDFEFRTLYYASRRYGAYLEKLATFRPTSHIDVKINKTFDETPDPPYGYPIESGVLTSAFFEPLVLGEAHLETRARFIDVEHEATFDFLAERVGRSFLNRHGFARFDRAIVATQERAVTRHLALELHTLLHAELNVVGIYYSSAHGRDVDCWALWDTGRWALSNHALVPIDYGDPELRDAAKIHRITLPNPENPLPADFPFASNW